MFWKKTPKWKNKPVTIDGVRFASQGEADRFHQLKLLERAGQIEKLQRQVRFSLVWDDVHICDYIADATYFEHGRFVVEDFKGALTPDGELKLKMMRACHRIDVRLIDKRGRLWSVFSDPRPKRRKRKKALVG